MGAVHYTAYGGCATGYPSNNLCIKADWRDAWLVARHLCIGSWEGFSVTLGVDVCVAKYIEDLAHLSSVAIMIDRTLRQTHSAPSLLFIIILLLRCCLQKISLIFRSFFLKKIEG